MITTAALAKFIATNTGETIGQTVRRIRGAAPVLGIAPAIASDDWDVELWDDADANYLGVEIKPCGAPTTLGAATWFCRDIVLHTGNHHATTAAGATIVWPNTGRDHV